MADVKYFKDLNPLATIPAAKIMAWQSDPIDSGGGFKQTKTEMTQDVADSSITGLDTTADTPKGAINENFDRAEVVNGHIIETINLVITSSGSVITASLDAATGSTLTFAFSTGLIPVDVSTPKTATLTAGSDTIPQENWLYVLRSDPTTLVSSIVGFPDDATIEYAPIGRLVVQSAATVQTDGVIKQHNYTDHIKSDGGIGHIHCINEWIRERWACYKSGVVQTITGSGTATVTYAVTSGTVKQLHTQLFPAFVNPATLYLVNDSVIPYKQITNIGGSILLDSTGATLNNRYYNLVIWGIASQTGTGQSKLFLNLPSGSYANQIGAEEDLSKYTNFGISQEYKGAAFLIAKILIRNIASSTFTVIPTDDDDLRGEVPNGVAGTSTAVGVEFPDGSMRVFNTADDTKKIAFDASGITTGNTRTITAEDKDVDMTDYAALSGRAGGQVIDGGDATTETLGLRNNAVDDKGITVKASGVIQSTETNYETLITDNADLTNKKYVDDAIGGVGAIHQTLIVDSPGKTSFILAQAAVNPTVAQLTVEGQVRIYGTDFTISGTTLTWNDPAGFTLQTDYVVQVWYDIDFAPNVYWSRTGIDLTPTNVDDNADMKKGYTQYGDGTSGGYSIIVWNNNLSTKPILLVNSSILSVSGYNTMKWVVADGTANAGKHLESYGGAAWDYVTTRSFSHSVRRSMGYAQNGNLSSGTRKIWNDEYDASTGNRRLSLNADGVIRTREQEEFAIDATQHWSRNNTAHPVAQDFYTNNDNMGQLFDCYWNGTNFISSSTTGNIRIWKKDGSLQIDTASGVAAGAVISFATSIVVSGATGNFTFNKDAIFKVYTTNVSSPPTSGQLTAAFGEPSAVGAGFTVYINDNNDNLIVWSVMSSGTSWFYNQWAKVI